MTGKDGKPRLQKSKSGKRIKNLVKSKAKNRNPTAGQAVPKQQILPVLPVVIRAATNLAVLAALIRVCALSELPPGTMRGVEQDGRRVLVVNIEGNLHAWDGTCSHEEADLSTGFLLGEEITCPLHLSRFNLLTGEAVNPPAEKPIGRRDVKVENGDVYVDLEK